MDDWNWVAGYVRNTNATELEQAIQKTLEGLSDHAVRLLDETEHANKQYCRATWEFYAISPQVRGWTAFWALMPRTCHWIFQYQQLSGLLLSGATNGPGDEGNWSCVLWEDGRQTHWFVSNPQSLFETWSLDTIVQHVLPFLQLEDMYRETDHSKKWVIDRFVDIGPEADFGSAILSFAKTNLDEHQIDRWLGMPPLSALQEASTILDIPFIGLDYFVLDIATFLDLRRGFKPPYPYLDHLTPNIVDLSIRSDDWKSTVEQFMPVLFGFSDDNPDCWMTHNELAHLFYFE